MSTTMDQVYHERDQVLALAAFAAYENGLSVWIGEHNKDVKHDKDEPEWDAEWTHIIYIQLPTGQVSWHIHDSELPLFRLIPSRATAWDGHTVEEKYARLERYVKGES